MNIPFRLDNEEIKIGENTYYVDGTFNVCCDRGYGADADGNRGTVANWIDDYHLTQVIKNENDITDDHSMSDINDILNYLENRLEKYI